MHFPYLAVALRSLKGRVDDNGYQQNGHYEVKDPFYSESESFLLVLRNDAYLVSLMAVS